MTQRAGSPEVVVTVDGVPRPAVVVQVDGERSQVRYRAAGGFTDAWVATRDLVPVEPGTARPPVLKLATLALLAVAGLFLLLHPGGSDTRLADLTVTPTPTASPTATATPLATAVPTRAAAPRPVQAVLIGDALSAGKGNPVGTVTALQLAGTQLRWQTGVLALSGSGFTTGGPAGARPFGVRFAEQVRRAPDVVILQGGSSDTAASAAQLTTAATSALVQIQRRFPATKVVLVGPVAMEQPADGQLVRVSRVLAAVAKARHIAFVDPIGSGWITAANAPGYTASTGYYPNARGHAYLARRFAEVLPALIG